MLDASHRPTGTASGQRSAGRRAVALAVSALSVTTLMTVAVAEAAFPGRNGLIAVGMDFFPGCDQSPSIVTIKPDGTRARVIAGCGERKVAEFPYWSADGRRLLFSANFGRPMLMSADGSRKRSVPLPDAERTFGAYSFAPDGQHFVFNRPTRDLWNMSAEPEIWRASKDGTEDRQLGEGWLPRWSPDGRMIAYVSRGAVRVMNAQTGQHLRALAAGNAASLDWSPDGRRLLWSPSPLGTHDLWVVRVDGERPPRKLPPGPQVRVSGAVWSPDGKEIAFATAKHREETESVRYSIWTMTARGSEARRIYRSDSVLSELVGPPTLSWGPRRR